MQVRLGQLLVDGGVLTNAQVGQVMERQHATGEPFGVICESLFKIDSQRIEEAWAIQYACLTRNVDPRVETVDQRALQLVTRRQAWQFRVLPIRFDGDELMIATTQQHLRRALRFATNVIGVPVYLVISSSESLGVALCRYYPFPGMTPRSVNDDSMDRILGDRGVRLGA
jgi:hypothetical protein